MSVSSLIVSSEDHLPPNQEGQPPSGQGHYTRDQPRALMLEKIYCGEQQGCIFVILTSKLCQRRERKILRAHLNAVARKVGRVQRIIMVNQAGGRKEDSASYCSVNRLRDRKEGSASYRSELGRRQE
uniref:Uncharacterized protein n=1 Tax=Timema genevievae TaxID=629358 RepID=A0A7R9K5D4_TIMGE|nr:unnamed protein product [Timema genevievae]